MRYSSCCGVKIIHYGKRRLQCTKCQRTWRNRPQKRGRPRSRGYAKTIAAVLGGKKTLLQYAQVRGYTYVTAQRKVARALRALSGNQHVPDVATRYVLVVDGCWCSISGKRHVIYLMVLRAVGSDTGHILPPYIRAGNETKQGWIHALELIPQPVAQEIVAMVSDGLTGLHNIAKTRGWQYQRCHFHFLTVFERFRGKSNRHVGQREFRERLYQTMRSALECADEDIYRCHIRPKLREAFLDPVCPFWMRRHLQHYFTHEQYFRACYVFPDLALPRTTGALESLVALVRDLLYRHRGFRTYGSALRWISAFLYRKKMIVCRGLRQPNI